MNINLQALALAASSRYRVTFAVKLSDRTVEGQITVTAESGYQAVAKAHDVAMSAGWDFTFTGVVERQTRDGSWSVDAGIRAVNARHDRPTVRVPACTVEAQESF